MAEIKTGAARRALHGGPEPTWPERLVGEIERLRSALATVIDMLDNCAGVPREPDSLPMMVIAYAREVLK
jgi:hypothetical protein